MKRDRTHDKKTVLSKIFLFKHYEKIWQFIFYVFLAFFCFIFYQLNTFQTLARKNNVEVPYYTDCIYVVLVALIIHVYRKIVFYLVQEKVERNLIEKYEGKYRVFQKEKVCKYICDIPHYLTSTISFYVLFWNTDIIPNTLLGNGHIYRTLDEYPLTPSWAQNTYLKQYYIFQLGHHLYSLVDFVYRRWRDPKFFEFTLHHFLAVSLIFFSYMFNTLCFGVVLMVTHDIGDIFLPTLRLITDIKNFPQWLIYFIGVATNATWIYGRVYLLPQLIHCAYLKMGAWPIYWQSFTFIFMLRKLNFSLLSNNRDSMKYLYYYLWFMCCTLLIMNTYWCIFLIRLSFFATVQKKIKNEYDANYDNAFAEKGKEKKINQYWFLDVCNRIHNKITRMHVQIYFFQSDKTLQSKIFKAISLIDKNL